MAVTPVTREELRGCDGFRVESPEGTIGWVEEVWLGPSDEPAALAVRTTDGRHALLPAEDVESLDLDTEWIVVGAEPRLLELDAPRVDGKLVASWRTTGNAVSVPHPPGLIDRVLRRSRRWEAGERPIWHVVAMLYGFLIALIAVVITLSFLVAHLATGRAY
jgi:hypothetical protein